MARTTKNARTIREICWTDGQEDHEIPAGTRVEFVEVSHREFDEEGDLVETLLICRLPSGEEFELSEFDLEPIF